MNRNRITYNLAGLFVGPAPATGYHILNSLGYLESDISQLGVSGATNIVFPVHRVTSFDYQINTDRTRILNIGKIGVASDSITTAPTVNFNFNYHNFGVLNELRLGLYINYYSNTRGDNAFGANFSVPLLSGLTVRHPNEMWKTDAEGLYWPFNYRDCRNFFVAIKKDREDLSNQTTGKAGYLDVDAFGFGNCYMTSYRTSAAVGEFPQTSVSYIGENMMFYTSGSGISIPAIDIRTYRNYSGIKCCIPRPTESLALETVLLPGNITVSVSGESNFGVHFNDLIIQGYDISMGLDRTPLTKLGYKSPLDRVIQFPVLVNLSFDIVAKNLLTGTLERLFIQDKNYNVDITVKNRSNVPQIYYFFRNAKYSNSTFQLNLNGQASTRFSFEAEIDPKDLSKGLFISGVIDQPVITSTGYLQYDNLTGNEQGYLLLENGGYILTET